MERAIFDASFFLSFLLPDEKIQPIIQQFIEGDLILIEPFIFSLEVVNALKYAFASKRIKRDKLINLVKDFQKLKNIDYVYDLDLRKLTNLSLKFDISIYDACYLYLASKTKLKLYSLDKKLANTVNRI